MPQTNEDKNVADAAEADRNELTPTSASEWGKRKNKSDDGFTTLLPSGEVVKMRRTLDLPMLLTTGRIPNPLAGIVQEMLAAGTSQFPDRMQGDIRAIKQLMSLLDATVVNAVIEPPFSRPDPQKSTESDEDYEKRLEEWTPDPGTVSVFLMDVQDKMFIFAVAQGGAADISRFREEQAAAMAGLPDGEGVRDSAKRTAGAGNREQRRAAAKPRKSTAKK